MPVNLKDIKETGKFLKNLISTFINVTANFSFVVKAAELGSAQNYSQASLSKYFGRK